MREKEKLIKEPVVSNGQGSIQGKLTYLYEGCVFFVVKREEGEKFSLVDDERP